MKISRLVLPAAVFCAILSMHVAWRVTRPVECTDESSCEAGCTSEPGGLAGYVGDGWHWLGLSYAASSAFAATVIRRAVERRTAATRAGAARGLVFSALLPFAGCWLVGCCGSPMLAIYLNLLGARFLPFAKPLIAAITALTLTLSWAWMRRREARAAASCDSAGACGC